MALRAKLAGRISLEAQMKGPVPQNLKQDLDAIEATLDRIIAMQRELIVVETITFSVFGKEYTAEAGMTWSEWCESKYNPGDFWCEYDMNVVFGPDANNFVDPDGNLVTPNMVIIANAQYDV
jgi:hypothetical protein